MTLVDHTKLVGVCLAIDRARGGRAGLVEDWLSVAVHIKLPPEKVQVCDGDGCLVNYCWTLTAAGDRARKRFLQKCIDKLK